LPTTKEPPKSQWRHTYFLIHPEIRRELRRRKADDEGETMRQIIHRALCRELGREDLVDAVRPD